MPLPLSGQIDMSQINVELTFPATTLISLNQASARALAGIPAGMISLSDFYGKSTGVAKGFIWSFNGNYVAGSPANGYSNFFDIYECDFATEAVTLSPTSNPNTVWYSGLASTTDKAYSFGGMTTRPINVANSSNRIDTLTFATATVANSVATTVVPRAFGVCGYDTSTYIYDLTAYSSGALSANSYRTQVSTLTSSPTTSSPLISGKNIVTAGIRNATTLFVGAQITPTTLTQMAFTYASQTFGATPNNFIRNAWRSNKAINTNSGFAYAMFGGSNPTPGIIPTVGVAYKYNTTTWANSTLSINPSPTWTAGGLSLISQGANWGQAISGGTSPAWTPRRVKLTYATDTFTFLPSVPVLLSSNNTVVAIPTLSDSPITYSF
jgi:hypothetical protein